MSSTIDREYSDPSLQLLHVAPLGAGEPQQGEWTGTKALMLAVLEDGIRSYLNASGVKHEEAEHWVRSERQRSPFSFIVVCQALGLDPGAVRAALARMSERHVASRNAVQRMRPNVRGARRMRSRSRSFMALRR